MDQRTAETGMKRNELLLSASEILRESKGPARI